MTKRLTDQERSEYTDEGAVLAMADEDRVVAIRRLLEHIDAIEADLPAAGAKIVWSDLDGATIPLDEAFRLIHWAVLSTQAFNREKRYDRDVTPKCIQAQFAANRVKMEIDRLRSLLSAHGISDTCPDATRESKGWGGWPAGEAGIRARVAFADNLAAKSSLPLDSTEDDLRAALALLDANRSVIAERERQLQILGHVVAKLVPETLASGTAASDHAAAVADELLRRTGGQR